MNYDNWKLASPFDYPTISEELEEMEKRQEDWQEKEFQKWKSQQRKKELQLTASKH